MSVVRQILPFVEEVYDLDGGVAARSQKNMFVDAILWFPA